jgi:hypothetical protein
VLAVSATPNAAPRTANEDTKNIPLETIKIM